MRTLSWLRLICALFAFSVVPPANAASIAPETVKDLALVEGDAREKESDPEIKGMLALTQAFVHLSSSDKATRLAAVRELAQSDSASVKTLLLGLLERKGGDYVERDAELRAEAEQSLHAVEQRLS